MLNCSLHTIASTSLWPNSLHPGRVEHFKTVLEQTKKKPNPYFGYAVALPLDLAPDTLADYFEDSYFD